MEKNNARAGSAERPTRRRKTMDNEIGGVKRMIDTVIHLSKLVGGLGGKMETMIHSMTARRLVKYCYESTNAEKSGHR